VPLSLLAAMAIDIAGHQTTAIDIFGNRATRYYRPPCRFRITAHRAVINACRSTIENAGRRAIVFAGRRTKLLLLDVIPLLLPVILPCLFLASGPTLSKLCNLLPCLFLNRKLLSRPFVASQVIARPFLDLRVITCILHS